MTETPERDDGLLAELDTVLAPDPLPAGLIERAEGLVDFMGTDRELVELLEGEPVGVRGTSGAELAFATETGSLSVELTEERGELRGQLLAGEVTGVGLQRPTGETTTVEVDELGRFRFAAVPAGPARLVLRVPGTDRPATTDWFVL
jgi:hypothetical protein